MRRYRDFWLWLWRLAMISMNSSEWPGDDRPVKLLRPQGSDWPPLAPQAEPSQADDPRSGDRRSGCKRSGFISEPHQVPARLEQYATKQIIRRDPMRPPSIHVHFPAAIVAVVEHQQGGPLHGGIDLHFLRGIGQNPGGAHPLGGHAVEAPNRGQIRGVRTG